MGEKLEDGCGLSLSLTLSLRCPEEMRQTVIPATSYSAFQYLSSSSWVHRPLGLGTGLDVNNHADEAVVVGSEKEEEVGVEEEEEEEAAARKRLRLSKEQAAVLEDMFKDLITPTMKQKVGLAKQLKLRPRQVEVWFQNRRARTKLKQSEEDYEHLKSYRKVLKDENNQLHKQVKELRGELKLMMTDCSQRMDSPTALLMCPSCQRITPVTTVNRSIHRSWNYDDVESL